MFESKREYDEINLMDLVYLMFRKIKALILFAVIGAAIGVLFSFVSGSSAKAVEKFQKEMAKYERTVAGYESDLAMLDSEISMDQDYVANSPFMKLNASDMYVANLSISVSPDKDSYSELVQNPKKIICAEYLALVKTLDLNRITGSDYPQSWLSEMISADAEGDTVNITLFGNSQKEVESFASSVIDAINKNSKEIADSSFNHTLICRSFIEKRADLSILAKQSELINEYSKTIESRDSKEESFKKLEAPSQFHYLKYGVLGFLAGGFIAAICYFVAFIFSHAISTSYGFETASEAPFLGYVAKRKRSLEDLVSKERAFLSDDEAKAFMKSQFATLDCDYENVAFVSSVSVDESVSQKLSSYFSKKVSVVGNAITNPETTEVVSKADIVVLLEKPWVSSESSAKIIDSIVKRCGKTLSGFVFFS